MDLIAALVVLASPICLIAFLIKKRVREYWYVPVITFIAAFVFIGSSAHKNSSSDTAYINDAKLFSPNPNYTSPPTEEPEDQTTPQPTAKPMLSPQQKHDARAKYHEFWNRYIASLGVANSTKIIAAAQDQRGNDIDSYAMIKKGVEYADNVAELSQKNVPDGWADVSKGMNISATLLADTYRTMMKYMESNNVADGAEVGEQYEKFTTMMNATTDAARTKYALMGGQRSDLDDLDQSTNHVIEIMGALSK